MSGALVETDLADSLRHTDAETGSRWYEHAVTAELLTSVTTINSATQGKPWIPPWSSRLTAEFSVDNLDMLARVKVCKGRDAAVKLAKDEGKRRRDLKADTGSYVHRVIECLILWAAEGDGSVISLPILPDHLVGADYDDDPIETVIDFMVDGFINFVADFKPEFAAAEMTVYNRDLGIAGTLDAILWLLGYGIGNGETLIAEPGNRLSLCVDAKTGKHPDVTWPEQIAAYRRMTECLLPLGEVQPMPATDAGAVLHLRPEYDRGYRLMLVSRAKDARAWNRFRRSADIFFGREEERAKPGKVVYPLRPDGTMPSPRVADLDGEGYDRAPGALHKAGVDDLEQLAGMTEGDCRACKGIGPKTIPHIRRMLADHGLALCGETAPDTKVA